MDVLKAIPSMETLDDQVKKELIETLVKGMSRSMLLSLEEMAAG
jgi:hypothetical protein